jgi:anti-sigma regulatory factor (Ser/Thr protein kinase)
MTVETPEIAIEHGNHVVHFYDDDADLAGAVARHLARALKSSGTAIMIATEAHRRAIRRELESLDIDPAHARLMVLDAEAAVSAFSVRGSIDRAGFDRVIGHVVREAAQSGGPVHAYGEMVAVLWDAGHVPAAIELERLWNDLGREVPFVLLCGYDKASVASPEHAGALRQVCELHSGIVAAPLERERDFSADAVAPRHARRFVTDLLRRWGHSDGVVQDAQLVISELATNAVIHAGSPFSVVVNGDDSGVRISVTDCSTAQAAVKETSSDLPSGRGLRMVSALSASWGVDPAPGGKTVWAQLRA